MYLLAATPSPFPIPPRYGNIIFYAFLVADYFLRCTSRQTTDYINHSRYPNHRPARRHVFLLPSPSEPGNNFFSTFNRTAAIRRRSRRYPRRYFRVLISPAI